GGRRDLLAEALLAGVRDIALVPAADPARRRSQARPRVAPPFPRAFRPDAGARPCRALDALCISQLVAVVRHWPRRRLRLCVDCLRGTAVDEGRAGRTARAPCAASSLD